MMEHVYVIPDGMVINAVKDAQHITERMKILYVVETEHVVMELMEMEHVHVIPDIIQTIAVKNAQDIA